MSIIKDKVDNIPALRFGGFEYSLQRIKFGEVVLSNIYGPRFNANDYDTNGNVKTIRGTDVSLDGELKYYQVPTAKLDEKTVENHKLDDGDLVMITTADCGLTGVFRQQDIAYIASAYAVKIKLNSKGFPYYFKYFFQTNIAKREIKGFIRKATVANLPGSDILKIRLNIPTLPEQKKIANFLSVIDKKIEQLTQKVSLLEQYKKGVLQQIFSQQIRFKDDDGGAFPDWEEKKLGEICIMTSSKRVYVDDYVESGIPFYRGKEITELRNKQSPSNILYIAKERYYDFKEKYGVPEKGDILITAVGTLGNVWKVNTDKDFYFKDGNLIWLKNIKADSDFTEYLIQLNTKELLKTSIGSTQKALTMVELRKIKLKFPCLSEQKKIANFLSQLDDKINQTQAQLEQTQDYKKGLLQQLFV